MEQHREPYLFRKDRCCGGGACVSTCSSLEQPREPYLFRKDRCCGGACVSTRSTTSRCFGDTGSLTFSERSAVTASLSPGSVYRPWSVSWGQHRCRLGACTTCGACLGVSHVFLVLVLSLCVRRSRALQFVFCGACPAGKHAQQFWFWSVPLYESMPSSFDAHKGVCQEGLSSERILSLTVPRAQRGSMLIGEIQKCCLWWLLGHCMRCFW